jgi:hypothetical protein
MGVCYRETVCLLLSEYCFCSALFFEVERPLESRRTMGGKPSVVCEVLNSYKDPGQRMLLPLLHCGCDTRYA